MKEQGLFPSAAAAEPEYSDTLALDLATVEPSLAGPRRPQDRVALRDVPRSFHLALPTLVQPTSPVAPPTNAVRGEAEGGHVSTVEARQQRHTDIHRTVDRVENKL